MKTAQTNRYVNKCAPNQENLKTTKVVEVKAQEPTLKEVEVKKEEVKEDEVKASEVIEQTE